MPADKIPLYELESYKLQYEDRDLPFKTTQSDLKFCFFSYEAARMAYYQFIERFIPKDKQDENFKYESTFWIYEPKEYCYSSTDSRSVWIVECGSRLTYNHPYREQIKQLANTTNRDSSKKQFIEYLNSYFEIPLAEDVRFKYNPDKGFNPYIQRLIYVDKRTLNKRTKPYTPRIRSLKPEPNTYGYNADGQIEGNNTFCAPGLPYDQINWPFARHVFPDYVTLLTQQNEQSLNNRLRINDYLSALHSIEKPKIIELGAGAGVGAGETKDLLPHAEVIAAGITPLYPENAAKCHQIYYAFIPNNLRLLQDHFGTAHVVIDVFGASTYAINPIHVLIYAVGLLAIGGKFMGVVSGLDDAPYTFDSSPLGAGINRDDLIKFFKEYLGIELEIKKTKVASRLKPGKIVEDFYVEFTKTQSAKSFVYDDFIQVCLIADKVLGIPHEIDVSSESDYGKFTQNQSIKSLFYTSAYNSKTIKLLFPKPVTEQSENESRVEELSSSPSFNYGSSDQN